MLIAALWVTAATAQEGEDAERCGALPPAVAATRQVILDAAAARDYAALAKLIDPAEFTSSFVDEGGDPVP